MKPLGILFSSLEAQTHIPEDAGTPSGTWPCLCGGCPGSPEILPPVLLYCQAGNLHRNSLLSAKSSEKGTKSSELGTGC